MTRSESEAFESTAAARRLDLERRRRGLSQKQLAEALGSSQPNVSKILSGKLAPSTRIQFAIERFIGSPAKYGGDPSITAEQIAEACRRSARFHGLMALLLSVVNIDE